MKVVAALALIALGNFCASAVAQSRQLMTFEEAKQRADSGDSFAQAVVALHYQLGWNTEKSPELAAKYALASANAGEPLGQFRLGALLRDGTSVPKDEQQGLRLQAASFNSLYAAQDPYSMTSAGVMIFQGKVIGQNIAQDERRKDATALCKKAADMGYAPAQFNYAMALNDGHGVRRDEKARDEYLLQSRQLNYPLAQSFVISSAGQPMSVTSQLGATAHDPSRTSPPFIEPVSRADNAVVSKEINGGDLSLVQEIDLRSGVKAIPQEEPETPRGAAMSRSGSVLAVIDSEHLYVYEARSGRLINKMHIPKALNAFFGSIFTAPDSETFYITTSALDGRLVGGEMYYAKRCFELDWKTGKLLELHLPKSFHLSGSNPETGVLVLTDERRFLEVDVLSGKVVRSFALAGDAGQVAAIYSRSGLLLLAGLSGGEGNALKWVYLLGTDGETELIRNDRDMAVAIAEILEFPAQSVKAAGKRDVFSYHTEKYGLQIGSVWFGLAESLSLTSNVGLLVNTIQELYYATARDSLHASHIIPKSDFLPVTGLSLSSDGSRLLSWNLGFHCQSGCQPRTMFREDGKLNTAFGVPDCRHNLASAYVYDFRLVQKYEVANPGNQIWSATLSADGNFVALASGQVQQNSESQKSFYGPGGVAEGIINQPGPMKVGISATPILFDLRSGSIVAQADPETIFPFDFGEYGVIVPDQLSQQAGFTFSDDSVVTRDARWTVKTQAWPEKRERLGKLISDAFRDAQNAPLSSSAPGLNWTNNWESRSGELSLKTHGNLSKKLTFPNDEILAAEVTNGKHIVVATRKKLLVYDSQTGELMAESTLAQDFSTTGLATASDGNKLVCYIAAESRGIKRFTVDVKTIKEDAAIFPQSSSGILIALASGEYLTSLPSIRSVHFTDGQRTFPFEQFDLRLNRPDAVLGHFGAPPEAVAIAKQLREKRLKRMGVTEEMLKPDFHVPELEIVGEVPTATDDNQINVAIKASDSKYPLERLKVYVNNVPVNGRDGELLREEGKTSGGLLGRLTGAFTESSTRPQTLERTVPIKLAAGRNKIQVSVLNSAGAESLYANAEINCTAKRRKPTLYAVAMGVSEYSNADWNLKYAAKDARDVLAGLKDKAGDQYGEVKELLLTDKDVTKENLAKVREFLKGATIDDTVLMFAAGHGLLDSKYDYYFGTTDIDFNNPSDKGIAFEEFDDILADLPCLKKSLLVDTCHAGELDQDEKALLASASTGGSAPLPTGKGIAMRSIGTRGMNVKAIEGARGASEWYDRLQGLFVDLRRGSGSTILTSAAGAEYALESSEQQNGLFTYAVLEALDGKPDADTNKDGSVQMSELGEYVKKRVSELTNHKQTPNTRRVNLEGDFTLAKTR